MPIPLEVWRGGPHLHEALLVAGKLVRPGQIKAVAAGRLVPIVDETSKRRFLADTGAACSIFPYSSPGKQSGPRLTGADGLHIPCWGERRLSLTLHGRLFVWQFLLAKVQFPIIGVDFLRHFKLLVDPAANPLVDTSPPSFCLQYPACAASPNQPRPRRWPLPHLSGVPPHHRYTLQIQPLPLSLVAAKAASPPGL